MKVEDLIKTLALVKKRANGAWLDEKSVHVYVQDILTELGITAYYQPFILLEEKLCQLSRHGNTKIIYWSNVYIPVSPDFIFDDIVLEIKCLPSPFVLSQDDKRQLSEFLQAENGNRKIVLAVFNDHGGELVSCQEYTHLQSAMGGLDRFGKKSRFK